MSCSLYRLAPLILLLNVTVTCKERKSIRAKGKPTVVVIDPEEVGRAKPIKAKEPDDTLEQANELAAGTRMQGAIGPSGSSTEDHDWYRIKVEGELKILRVTLSGVSGLDLRLEAFSARGKRLMRVDNGKLGEGEILVNLSAEEGTYYLLVTESKGRTAASPYLLSYELRPLAEGEEREPNWKEALANEIPLNSEISGYLGWHTDTDWFKLALGAYNPYERIVVEYDGLDDVRAQLLIRDSEGKVLQQRWGALGAGITLSNLAPPRGQPHIYVVLRCRRQFNVESSYSLRVHSVIPTRPTEAEPNDTSLQSTGLVPGNPIFGTLMDGKDRDIYAIKARRPTLVRIKVIPSLKLDVALALLGDDGAPTTIIDEGGVRAVEHLPTLWLRPPQALIQVWAPNNKGSSAAADYRLDVEVLADDGWEHEPNDLPQGASTWLLDQPAIKGHIHPKADVDHFRIRSASGAMQLSVSSPPGCLVEVELLDASGASLGSPQTPNPGGELQLFLPPLHMEYILRVKGHTACADSASPYRIVRRGEEP